MHKNHALRRIGVSAFLTTHIEWVAMLCGVYGLLFLFFSMDRLAWNPWLACAAAAITEFVLWRANRSENRLPIRALLVGVPLLLALLAWQNEELQVQLRFMVVNFPASGGYAIDATGAMIWLAVALAYVFFWLEGLARVHWPLLLFTAALLPVCPVVGIYPGLASVFFLLIFQVTGWGLRGTARFRRQPASERRRAGSRGRQIALASLGGLAVAFVLSWLVVGWGSESFYSVSYQAEGAVRQALQRNMGDLNNPNTGVINRGNLYPIGKEQLKLSSAEVPSETLYLKGFSGGDYEGGVWQEADEQAIFDSVSFKFSGSWIGSWVDEMWDDLYFAINTVSMLQVPAHLTIQYQSAELPEDTEQRYRPYYSTFASAVSFVPENGYHVSYYTWDDMQIDWGNVHDELGFSLTLDDYHTIALSYANEAVDVYTQVPLDSVPNLVQHCENNPLENLDEITAFILYTLQNDTAYTRTPGLTPANRDPVEYFLFQSKKGYCQHYASAAVLMYRMYGIPARYATGYAVSPDAFQAGGQSYEASVTDEDAHAWVEIFLENYGWTPVEVTPSGAGISGGYPGLDPDTLQSILLEQDWDMSVIEGSASGAQMTVRLPGTRGRTWLGVIPINRYTKALAVFLLALAVVGVYKVYRRVCLARLQRMDSRTLFGRLLQAIQFDGRLRGYVGSEADFAQQFAAALPAFSPEDVQQVLDIVNRAAFGHSRIPVSQTKIVRRFYFRVMQNLYVKLPWWKKIVFRYGKQFF